MGHKRILSLVIVGILAGCSKKEEAPPPSASATKTETKSPTLAALATDAQTQVNSVATQVVNVAQRAVTSATNTIQAAANSTNVLTQRLAGTINRVTEPPSQPSASAPVTPSTPPSSTAVSPSIAGLSSDQVTQGIKEALGKGLQHAVSTLGQPGGFLTNLNVKIPIPDKLQLIEKGLRAINQGQYADQCITTMNQAAEQAVPAAADVFVNSLKNMSVEDAKGLLSGPQDAATQFFRKATETELTAKFSPIVQQAMTKCGTTAAYQQLLDKAKGVSPIFSNPSLDLNAYVTSKAMDGLFKTIAEEEKRIRENPVARSTDLLKSVFGSLQK
jgi:Protein of unknown function (DUF4197)